MLIHLLELVIVIGLLLYIVQILPIVSPFKQIAIAVVCVIALLWVLEMFGGGLGLGCSRLTC